MGDPITEYQRWKQKGEDLRSKAKQAMENRFRELLLEAVDIAEEYRSDFGGTLKPPPAVTGFRYKASARRPRKSKAAAKTARATKVAKPKPDPRIARLRKRLETAKGKLEKAKAAGEPTKNIEDKIYEIEDDLRLALSGD